MTDAPADLIEVGAVADAYGVRGEIRVDPFNEPRESVLLKARSWWLQWPGLRSAVVTAPSGLAAPSVTVANAQGRAAPTSLARSASGPTLVAVKRCRTHGSVLLASLEGVGDRDSALTLKGARICVRRADFPAPASGEVYWVDLLGCAVSNQRSEHLGSVIAVDDHGAHPILVLRDDSGRERLIPYVPVYVLSTDVAERRIVVDWELDY